jgi:hypothetical protein
VADMPDAEVFAAIDAAFARSLANEDHDDAEALISVDDAFNHGDPSLMPSRCPLPAAIDLFRAECKHDGRIHAEQMVADEFGLDDDQVTVVGALADMVDRMIGDA